MMTGKSLDDQRAVNASRAGAQIEIARARFGDLRRAARVQKRSFPYRLAYSYPTLLLLRFLPSARFVVAREGDAILGMAIGDQTGGQSRVVNLCVDPDARRRGVGSRLLRKLEEELPTGDIMLMAQIENDAARQLYKKEGYQEIGVSRNYYGRGKDGVWMQKVRTNAASPKPPTRDLR